MSPFVRRSGEDVLPKARGECAPGSMVPSRARDQPVKPRDNTTMMTISIAKGEGACMHILIVVVVGLVALAAFYFGAGVFGASHQTGAFVFIWLWLVASIINGAF